MIRKTELLQLPEGNFYVEVQVFDNSDRPFLRDIYRKWRSLCADVVKLRSRTINLPEGLSEATFCLETGAVRRISGIPGANSSFDCYDLKTKERLQVKACSLTPDLTSFGPRSVWDKLYFLDFYRDGKWDGTYDIYLIDNNDIYNCMVSRTESFTAQQAQRRRPRFSVYDEIIQPKGLRPIKTAKIW